jgi:putative NADPH-quinone reductase
VGSTPGYPERLDRQSDASGDRIRVPGRDSGEGIPKGLLRAKAAVVLSTSNTEPERERSVFGDPLETIWKNCVFGLCGVTIFYRRTFSVVITSTEAQRRQWLDEVRASIDTVFPNEEDLERTM